MPVPRALSEYLTGTTRRRLALKIGLGRGLIAPTSTEIANRLMAVFAFLGGGGRELLRVRGDETGAGISRSDTEPSPESARLIANAWSN